MRFNQRLMVCVSLSRAFLLNLSSIHMVSTVLSPAIEKSGDPYAPVRALRKVRHDRLKKQLFEMDKDARLRSGQRGFQARKALTAFEKIVEESTVKFEQEDSEIEDSVLREESEAALDLLTELQGQLEPVSFWSGS